MWDYAPVHISDHYSLFLHPYYPALQPPSSYPPDSYSAVYTQPPQCDPGESCFVGNSLSFSRLFYWFNCNSKCIYTMPLGMPPSIFDHGPWATLVLRPCQTYYFPCPPLPFLVPFSGAALLRPERLDHESWFGCPVELPFSGCFRWASLLHAQISHVLCC